MKLKCGILCRFDQLIIHLAGFHSFSENMRKLPAACSLSACCFRTGGMIPANTCVGCWTDALCWIDPRSMLHICRCFEHILIKAKPSHRGAHRYNDTSITGLIGAGTNNARLAGLLRSLSGYYYKEPTLLFLVRVAQGLVHMGKGLLTMSPTHGENHLLSGANSEPLAANFPPHSAANVALPCRIIQ